MSNSPSMNSTPDFNLFEDEERVLAQAGVLAEHFVARSGDLAARFEELVSAYRESISEKQRLVRLGDRHQEQLRRIGAELKEKNRILEEQSRHLLVLNTELAHEIEARKTLELELRVLATTDPLTGLYNRRRFLELGDYEIQRWQRTLRGLALLVLDLDHFKRVNDQHGHAAGDEVLRRFAMVCKNNLRAMDSMGRIGGEEFAILLPETNLEEGAGIAEKVRRVLADSPMSGPEPISITVSIGVVVAAGQETFAQLLARGDACLYAAKGQGRNRVVAGTA